MRTVITLFLLSLILSSTAEAQRGRTTPKPPLISAMTEICDHAFDAPTCDLAVGRPVTAGQRIGTIVAQNNPTTFQLAQLTTPTYFAISNAGIITITAAGASAINALTANTTYNLTVTATNAGGTGTGMVTVNVRIAPPVIGTATFNLVLPVAAGQTVGTVPATGGPTSWAITGGSP